MAVYKDKNGTWYVSARYTNWKGEADRKLKRGFQTKKEATRVKLITTATIGFDHIDTEYCRRANIRSRIGSRLTIQLYCLKLQTLWQKKIG